MTDSTKARLGFNESAKQRSLELHSSSFEYQCVPELEAGHIKRTILESNEGCFLVRKTVAHL